MTHKTHIDTLGFYHVVAKIARESQVLVSLASLRAFISYSRKNKEFAEKLVGRLQNRCLVWWDQRLTAAEIWWTTILEEIERCDCFVLILTPAYTGSVFCLTELEYAQKLGKPILPIVPDRAVKFPPGVAHTQAAFIDGFVVAEAFGEIIAGLSGLKPAQYKAAGSVKRPSEPTPTGQTQISDLYADAAEAEAAGNLSLAERFYEQVVQFDRGTLGTLADEQLRALRKSRNCRADYENIVRLAANPATLNSAVNLWRAHVEQCGTDYDYKGFAQNPGFKETRLPANNAPQPQPTREQQDSHQPVRTPQRAPSQAPGAPGRAPASGIPGITYGVMSHVGMVRTSNQDAFYAKKLDNSRAIFVVCDGMGGHKDGERASQAAVKAVADFFEGDGRNIRPEKTPDTLVALVQQANKRVITEASEGGTTLSLCAIIDKTVYTAHVGDSRIYRIANGKIEQLTRDHSLVQRLIELDQLAPDEVPNHPQRNVLYRALGQMDNLAVDTGTFPVEAKETYLLCSDGLWLHVPENTLIHEVDQAKDLQKCVETLVKLANDKGGVDNVTALLFRVA